jgi:hypothetical protein
MIKESIRDSINKAVKEIASWPKWKQTFLCLENNNTFTKVDLNELNFILEEKNV